MDMDRQNNTINQTFHPFMDDDYKLKTSGDILTNFKF